MAPCALPVLCLVVLSSFRALCREALFLSYIYWIGLLPTQIIRVIYVWIAATLLVRLYSLFTNSFSIPTQILFQLTKSIPTHISVIWLGQGVNSNTIPTHPHVGNPIPSTWWNVLATLIGNSHATFVQSIYYSNSPPYCQPTSIYVDEACWQYQMG